MPASPVATRPWGAVLLALLALTACGDDTPKEPAPRATALLPVDGAPRSGTAGAALAQPFVVRVTDQNGQPFPNVAVTFAVTAGGGTVTPTTATTDAQGTARTTLTLGPTVGVNTITASATRDGTPLLGSPLSLSAVADDGLIIGGQVSAARGSLLGFNAFGNLTSARAAFVPGAIVGANDATPLAEVPDDRYIVYVRREAIDLPGVQQVGAWQSRAVVRDAVEELKGVLAPFARAGVAEVLDVSPVLGAMRVRITDPAGIAHGVQQLAASEVVQSVAREVVGRIDDYAVAPIEPPKMGATLGGPMSQVLPTQSLPNDPLLVAQFWPLAMIEAPRAWRVQQGSLGVLVAVIDNGARFDHPAMAGVYTNDGYNFMSGLRLPVAQRVICGGGTLENLDTVRDTTFTGYRADPTQLDDYTQTPAGCWQRSTGGGHGLHVAGTIGALGGDSVGTTGVAQRVRIRPIRACGVTPACGTDFDLAQAILYAAGLPASDGRGGTVPVVPRATVANMSLGGYADTQALREAVTAATNAGMLLVASAGNAPTAANFLPAAYPAIISVAALGPDGNLTDYTTIGNTIDLASPGGTFRFGAGSGGVASTTWNFVLRTANYSYYAGTSMAAPHVTGVAALVAAQNPGFTAAQLRARLEQTATDMGAPGRDNVYGFGLVNARAALTGSMPAVATVVKLLNATTGDSVAAVVAGADGAYRFARLTPAWVYTVLAGQDEDGDRRAGLPGRRFGWHGGARAAEVTTTAGQGPIAASFQIGLPIEAEPNNEAATATPLFVNGWAAGSIGPLDPSDYYRVRVPRTGAYVVETFGIGGSCGYGLELDTVLEAFDPLGANALATNDDTVFPGSQFCSRLTRTIEAGATALFRVRGFSAVSAGQYRITVRPAP